MIDAKSARDGHLRVGDFTTVLVNGPPQRVQVVGIIGFGTADSPGGASTVLFMTPVAQRLAGNLRQALPHGLEAITGAALIKEMQDQGSRSG